MVVLTVVALFCCLAIQIPTSDAIRCYTCANEVALVNCNKTVDCPAGAGCYLDYSIFGGSKVYSLGCRDTNSCPVSNSTGGSGSLIGRDLDDVIVEDPDTCSQCCNDNNCNRNLCQESYPNCTDTAVYNCASVGSSFNLCEDVVHAKDSCRRFCGLCSLVDGMWSDWTGWSACDVSCGEGSQVRNRTCTNPPPEDGGENCKGISNEFQNCSMVACPVDGQWSNWASWSNCSSPCDIGFYKRARRCDNPPPAFGGSPCYGDTVQQDLCFPGACADGGWGSWGNWSSCSRSCDAGLRSRTRLCDSPPRSLTGKDCPGESTHSEICREDVCHNLNIAFSAKGIGKIPSFDIIKFLEIKMNEGSGYDNSTGRFTAPVDGTYMFSSQLCPKNSAMLVQFVKNYQVIDGFNHGTGSGGCSTMVSISSLKMGDEVWVASYFTGGEVFENDNIALNMFSGVLVNKI